MEAVEAPVGLHREGDQLAHRVAVGHVETERRRLTPLGPDALSGQRGPVGIEIPHHDAGALLGQPGGGRRPDARGPAGHHHDLAVEELRIRTPPRARNPTSACRGPLTGIHRARPLPGGDVAECLLPEPEPVVLHAVRTDALP